MCDMPAGRIGIVGALFRAWSSGDPDAPRRYLTDDAVLSDSVGGDHHGWPAIRAYFARGLEHWPDLSLVPTGEFWSRTDGLAFTWVMSATVHDDRFGAGTAGRVWRAPGMSYVVFDRDRVRLEVDYHDAGARARSLTRSAS
jgi:ketosteroid isomerase-like protein